MLAHSFLTESSSKLLVTRTGIKAWTSSILGLWFPWPIIYFFFLMKFDLGILDSGQRSLPFGLLVSEFEPRQKLNQSQISFDNLMGVHLVNINVYAKFHHNILHSSRDSAIITFSEFGARQSLDRWKMSFRNLFRTERPWSLKLGIQHRESSTTKFVQIMISGGPLTFNAKVKFGSLCFCMGKRLNSGFLRNYWSLWCKSWYVMYTTPTSFGRRFFLLRRFHSDFFKGA